MNRKLETSPPDLTVLNWASSTEAERRRWLTRPVQADLAAIDLRVQDIVRRVRTGGDEALRQLIQTLDRAPAQELWVSEADFDRAEDTLPAAVSRAINDAFERLVAWHRRSRPEDRWARDYPGCTLGTVYRPIPRVGLYVPAGSAPLPSTALMLGVPAMVAGCEDIILSTPSGPNGSVDPATLVAARRCGIQRVLKAGGAHAVAAMAYGTESVPKADKLFGPGNVWVTRAKQHAALDPAGAACDLPAGPSEVLVIADGGARAEWIAADLLSQAEHGADSQVLAVLLDERQVASVRDALFRQLEDLPRKEIARQALQHARLILADGRDEALEIANRYAPEHLILQVEQADGWLDDIQCAGSVFLGAYAPESAGDYASGTNHVLPTGGHARACSGLSVGAFMNALSVQQLSADALRTLAPTITELARWEGLEAHARAVIVRLGEEAAES